MLHPQGPDGSCQCIRAFPSSTHLNAQSDVTGLPQLHSLGTESWLDSIRDEDVIYQAEQFHFTSDPSVILPYRLSFSFLRGIGMKLRSTWPLSYIPSLIYLCISLFKNRVLLGCQNLWASCLNLLSSWHYRHALQWLAGVHQAFITRVPLIRIFSYTFSSNITWNLKMN